MIGNRNIGIVNASAVGDLIIRNLNNKLKVILFILILAAGGSISSFGQLCPAVPFGYQYQKTFEINGSLVGGVLINFPVLVNITNPISNELKNVIYGGHVCDINGNDIIFTDANYNRLEHQIESYNNTTGRLIAWVRFPILGNSGNTTFRVLYGNCQITSSQSSGIVWSPDYRGVWHLSGSDYTDASPAGNDGTPNIVSTASGKIAGGASFNGNSSYLRMPSLNGVVATNQPHTISIWAKYNPVPNTVQNFISFQNSGDMSSVQVGFRGSRPNAWKWEGATLASAPTAPSTKDWHYYVYTFDGTTHRLYVDGVPHQSTASAQTGIPNEANLGRYNNGEYFDGELDEARYSVTARSAEWITTEFNNQNDQVMGSGRFIQSIGPETEYNSPSYYIFDLCEGTTVNYRIPSQAGHTYTWTITGGTPATYVGNPVTVTWGAPGTGTIMLNDHSGLCDGNSPVYSVIIRPRPTAPTLNTKTPNLPEVCAGQSVSATFNPGTGGVGCTDAFQYRYDGSGIWATYTPGTGLSTTGHTLVEIQGRRAGCTGGPGCTESDWVSLASWIVNPQPLAPTLAVKTPNLMVICAGQTVSATFNPGSGGTGCTDAFQYRFDGGSWATYFPGQVLGTNGHISVTIRGMRGGCTSLSGCSGTTWYDLATWTVNPQPLAPTINTRIPDLAAVCEGTLVSATFNSGTGGSGCSDSFQYRFDGTGTWYEYTPGNTINTTGHTLAEIQGRRSDCTAGSGCTGTGWADLASWNVNPQPAGPALDSKSPDLAAVCAGQAVSATFTSGSGGVGCSDLFQYSYDGSGTWINYTPGNAISTSGHNRVQIRGQRSGCTAGSGCTETAWVTLAEWNVNLQPTGPALDVRLPALAAVCAGQAVSATFVAGSGGVGCSDAFEYSYDNSGIWSDYISGSDIGTTGHTRVEIRGQRTGCTAGSGCTGTGWATLASWDVNPQPTGPALNVKSPDLAAVCGGETVSATFTSGSGGAGCSDVFQYSYDGSGTWNGYIPGNGISTAGHNRVQIRGQRAGCTTGSGCTGTSWATLADWNVNLQPVAPTLAGKLPNLAAVCAGQAVSATFMTGSGGVGCSDAFGYSYDNSGIWNNYLSGSEISTTGHSKVEIRGQRTGCTAGSGCTGTSWVTLAEWNVYPQPTSPALNVKTPDLAATCAGQPVSATFVAGSGGAGCTDSFRYSYDGSGTWTAYTPGSTIITTGHTLIEIQGRRAGCTTGSGCTGTDWTTLVSWDINLQPAGPALDVRSPALVTVCAGQPVSATFLAGSGGVGCSDVIEFSYDNSGNWSSYIPGSDISTTGHSRVEIRGQRTGCTADAGCTGTEWVILAAWDINLQPTGPTLDAKTPDLATICDGQPVSAAFTAGTGGVGCSDAFEYSYNNSGIWNNYIPGSDISTTGHSRVEIRGQRTGCTSGAGCTGTDWVILATWDINLQPTGPVLDVKTPDLATICDGQPVSATFTAGTGGVGCSDVFGYSYDNSGIWSDYTPGSNISTTGHSKVEIRGHRTGCTTGAGCTGTDWATLASWDVNPQPTSPALNIKSPALDAVCDGETVSATFSPGTGGVGCTDSFRYSYDGTSTWVDYTPGSTIITTGHTLIEIQGRRAGCTAGAGCTGTDWAILVSWNINPQPTGPTLDVKTPDLATICDGQPVSATFTAGTGGVGCSDAFGYSYDNSGFWNDYIPGSDISTTGHTRVEIRGQRTGCTAGAGCTGTDWIILATWDINPQPTGPTLDAKTPDLAAVCDGETVSATFTPGTGGVGCTDSFRYSYDGTGTWIDYTPGTAIITTGHSLVEIQGRSSGCTAGSGCGETPWETLVSWVVNPYPVLSSTLTPDPVCSGSVFSYTPESSVPLTGFAWTRTAVAGILPGTDGSGNGNPNEVLENTTSVPINVRYQYTLSANGCSNSTIYNVDVVVNPIPVMSSTLTPDPICSGTVFNYTPQSLTADTNFDWTRAEVAGISTSGSGSGTDNPNEILTNNTNSPVTVSYVYTLTANGCTNPSDFIVNITVNPTADVAQPDDQVVCNEGATADIEFTTGNTGGTVTYTWTNDTPSIGLAGTGNGDIPTFTATNTTLVPVVATIIVTPHFENGGTTCDGPAKTFTITVNPTADVVQPVSQVVCNDAPTLDIVFTTGNGDGVTTYTWTNDTPSIGLAGSGDGDIPAFTALNDTDDPVVATITVTPYFTFGGITCDGPSKTFTITVDPTPQIIPSTLTQTICNNGQTNIVIGSPSTYSSGVITFDYTVTATGGVTGFSTPVTGLPKDYVIADILLNPTNEIQTVTYTITPVTATGCGSGPATVIVTVLPTPLVAEPADQVLCNGELSAEVIPGTLTVGDVTFTWTNTDPSIGLPASGNGNIPSFAAINNGDNPVVAEISIVPHFTLDGFKCDGLATVFTITINPTPQIYPEPEDIIQCDSTTTSIRLQSPSTFSSGLITFKYTTAATGGMTGYTPAASGLLNDHVITDNLVNPTDSPQTVTYTITPVSPLTGCNDGPSVDVVVTVNPTPRITPVDPVIQCDSSTTNIILQSPSTFTEGNVSFRYTAVSTGGVTGYTSSASGLSNNHVIEDFLVNTTDSPQTVTYTITPVSPVAGCNDGPSVDIVVTVNPTPRITPVDPVIQCDSTTTNIVLQSPSTFTNGDFTFRYTTTATTGVTGYTPGGSELPDNHVISDFLVNLTDSPQTVTYTVTPESPVAGCSDGPSIDIVVTVNPTPRILPVVSLPQCDSTTTSILLQSPSTFTSGAVTFSYTATATGGVTGFTPGAAGLPNNHVIEDTLVNPTDAPQSVTYTVTPVNPVGGCSDGSSVDYVVWINPTPRLLPVVPAPQCDSTTTNINLHSPSTFTSGVVKFRYTASAPAGVTGYTTSADNLDNDYVISDFLVNLTDSPQTVTYKITPVSPLGCNDGPSIDIEVVVNPTPRIYPEPADIIQCDSTATDITLESPSTFTTGLVTFRFTASATGGVTGFTPNASGLPNNHVIADNLVNPTDLPQTVTYIITPVSPLGCSDGPSVNVVVTVNPTPGIIPVAPVIQCDSTTTAISLQSQSTFTTGLITFKYTTSAPAEVTGHTASATNLPNNHVITDNLVNLSDSPQTVTYHVVPVSPLSCADGPGIDITVTINPTPRIFPVPPDVIICDSTTTSITVESPSTFTSGLVTINYTASAPAGLSGYTENATGMSNGFIIGDHLVNTTDAPITVTYRLVPVSGVVCNNGPAIEVKVTVNPTPRAVPVNVSPAICYGDMTAIRLESPTIMTSGEIRFDYNIAVPSGVVAGNPNSGINMRPGDILSLKYSNTNDTVQSVFFSITPKVEGLNCPAGNTSVQEVQLHPRPVRGINILEPFTCETSVGLATLEADISGGAGPYSVSWGGPVGYTMEDSLVITSLYAGYYWLEVTDSLGCKGDSSINIANLSASPRVIPLPVLPNIHVSCPGGNDGTARIFVREGITKPYSYWFMRDDGTILYTGVFSDIYNSNDPTTYRVCENLTAGTYTLLIRDINGCETIRLAELNDPDPIIVSMALSDHRGSNISCRGYSDGFVEASAVGGTAPYTYYWYPESGSLTVSNNTSRLDSIPAGKYYLLVTDFMGCTKTDSTTLTDPPGMDLASSEVSRSNDNIYNISCNGASDGYIKIEVIGGSGNYTYSWTGPDGYSAVTKDISGLKTGTYICTVTDINGCILTPKPEFLLEEPVPLVVTSVSSESSDGDFNITCAGGTGTVDVTVTGGSIGNYTYLWTTSDGSGIVEGEQDQNSLTAGIYHLRVTDLNGCITETDITLTEPAALVTELIPTHINCQVSGFNNGSIDLEVSGGIAPYSYLWSNGAVTQDISGLTQGMYQVEVTDANGCETSGSILIEDPPPLTYEPVISDFNGYNITCYGRSDGSVQINPTSGTPPYIFSWEGPGGFTATTKDISGLTAGSYILNIIDSKMCTVVDTIEIAEPGNLGMIVTKSESVTGGLSIDCAGGKTGSISVESVNNAGSVDYLWSDGEMGSTRTGLMAGYYKVITIDSNGCTADSTILLTEPDSIVISFAVTQPQCTDMPDGGININVTGGANSGYTYLWSDNSTTQNIATAVSGVYSVTVTDANGCSATSSVTINPVNDLCLELPNAISPNGDNINDLWNIGLRELYPEMEVTIFNRWGESVWKSGRGYPVPWDGRSNGNMLPMDSYHYIIDLKNGRKPIIGTITVVK